MNRPFSASSCSEFVCAFPKRTEAKNEYLMLNDGVMRLSWCRRQHGITHPESLQPIRKAAAAKSLLERFL
jgi:hypothetical protein